jgi:hypothetical protein
MIKTLRFMILCFVLVTNFVTSGRAADDAKTSKAPAAKSMPSPVSDKDIADAKAKGLVWVNTNTKVYHKDGEFYGKTKQGKFMTQADAQKAGYREAKPSGAKKKTSAPTVPKK